MASVLSEKRVLLVEDEALVAMATQLMLEDFGVIVLGPATTIDEAIDVIETEEIDLAVLDINLKGTPSYPIADELTSKSIPFLFVTGYDKPDQHKDAPVLNKPIREARLEAMIAKMLA